MNNRKESTGVVLVLLAGICWGVISIFIKGLTAAGFDSLSIVLIRSFVTAAVLFLYFLVKDPELLRIRLKDLWMFLGTGVVSTAFFSYCYFTTIVNCGAAVGVVLLYTSPIFVMLMSAVIFREKITKKKAAALIVTFLGCILVAGLAGSRVAIGPKALLIGLGSGFGYALYSIFGGFAVRKYASLTITFYTLLFSGISMLFLVDLPGFFSNFRSSLSFSWYCMLGIALLCTLIPYFAYTEGLRSMDAGRAAVLVTVEPLVGSALGILAYREPADIYKLAGIALIFTAVLMLGKNSKTD